jgi:hypothetical protein
LFLDEEEAMSTLALKPGFHFRPKSFHPKRDHRKDRGNAWHSAPWRTISVTSGAIALAFFCVGAPIVGDPAGRLFALDQVSTIPALEWTGREAWGALAFEFTPTMLGPAINAEMLAEEDLVIDEAGSVLTMPELEVHALPPNGEIDIDSPG